MLGGSPLIDTVNTRYTQGAESSLTEMSNEELISMVSLDLSSAVEG